MHVFYPVTPKFTISCIAWWSGANLAPRHLQQTEWDWSVGLSTRYVRNGHIASDWQTPARLKSGLWNSLLRLALTARWGTQTILPTDLHNWCSKIPCSQLTRYFGICKYLIFSYAFGRETMRGRRKLPTLIHRLVPGTVPTWIDCSTTAMSILCFVMHVIYVIMLMVTATAKQKHVTKPCVYFMGCIEMAQLVEVFLLWPLFLTWINFNPNMEK